MNKEPIIKVVDKFAAAEGQLLTAIDLFFRDGNQISTYTLARAAHEILDDLCRHNGLERGVLNEGLKHLDKPAKKRIMDKVNEAKNFFKHAANDPKNKINWNPEITIHFIIDSISLYRRLTKKKDPYEIFIFYVWYRAHNPEGWPANNNFDNLMAEMKDGFAQLSKLRAYEAFRIIYENSTTHPDVKK